MNFWNEIYSHFSPIAFSIFGFNVHWYGIAYVTALLSALFIAKFFSKNMDRFKGINQKMLDSYFIWAEVGVLLGARFGYLFIYTDSQIYYLTHPWQAFNPYVDGEFVGIAGMSFHGAVIGIIIASFLFSYVKKVDIFVLLDLVAISVPLAYTFGRIGNFLNKELYGRVIENESLKFIGIYVENALRYPSQLIEAFLEGIVAFFIVYFASKISSKKGMLIVVYAFCYGIARFLAEYTREADSQMGYYFLHLSMGQILSLIMILVGFIMLLFVNKEAKKVS